MKELAAEHARLQTREDTEPEKKYGEYFLIEKRNTPESGLSRTTLKKSKRMVMCMQIMGQNNNPMSTG
jgi:hypothetical protein